MKTAPGPPLLATQTLCVDVADRRLLASLELAIERGEFVAVLGPNGTGKTLTLLSLAGLRPPASGAVLLNGKDINALGRREVASLLALLPQSTDDVFPSTVLDTALIGRHPHVGRWRWESETDRKIALDALRTMDIDELASRDILTLSGGERRRLAIAQVLAQAPELFLLDEPLNHLDPQHQLDALAVFRRRVDDGASVVATLHDVNLAARFADRCLLLYGNGHYDLGQTDEVLDESRLSRLYATAIESVPYRSGKLFVASPR